MWSKLQTELLGFLVGEANGRNQSANNPLWVPGWEKWDNEVPVSPYSGLEMIPNEMSQRRSFPRAALWKYYKLSGLNNKMCLTILHT